MPQPLSSAVKIWHSFCERFDIAKECVPLFQTTEAGRIATRSIGKGSTVRPVLARSPEMGTLILQEVDRLQEDWESKRHKFDGLIYLIGWKQHGQFLPLYISKAETFGKGDGNLSANMKNIKIDCSKFAQWGDNYAYHLGDLSACVLSGHSPEKQTTKYKAWAETLCVASPAVEPVLKKLVNFWAKRQP